MKGLRFMSAPAIALTLGCVSLAACATPSEPKIVTREVSVPVAVKCASDPGPEPKYADTREALLAAPDIFEKTKLLLAGRAQRSGYIIELLAANSGCR